MSNPSRLGRWNGFVNFVSFQLASTDRTELPVGHCVPKRWYACFCDQIRVGLLDGRYEQVITIKAPGVSLCFPLSRACCLTHLLLSIVTSRSLPTILVLTRAPMTEPTALTYVKEWAGIDWLIYSGTRVGNGFNLDIKDVYRMRQMCREWGITVLQRAVALRRLAHSAMYSQLVRAVRKGSMGKMEKLQLGVSALFPGGHVLIPGVIQHRSVLLVRLCLWLTRRSCARHGLRPRAHFPHFPTHPHADQDIQFEYERDLAR